jgi:ABC-type cobalamin transport system ATPase subunit
MIGSPGAGKLMLAARLPSILPLPSGTIRLEAANSPNWRNARVIHKAAILLSSRDETPPASRAAFFAAGLFRVGSRRACFKIPYRQYRA